MAVQQGLRLIGDVHGHYGHYRTRAEASLYSLQIGDFGFDYRSLAPLSSSRHRVLAGNHDDYTRGPCPDCVGESCVPCGGRGFLFARQPAHFLPDFGPLEMAGHTLFCVRGAWSIDHRHRTPGRDWWPDEEMSGPRLEEAVRAYEKAKPDVVVSHTAPASIIPQVPFERIFGPKIHTTRTDDALEAMLKLHRPRLWVFGHFHHSWDAVLEGTRFVCLDELDTLDLPLGGVS